MFPVGNNLNRGHIYFQDFWKCSSILNKAKQLQFNRKQKLNQKKEEKEAHLGLTWLGPAYWLGQSPPTSRQEAGARARRAPATRRPPPASADAGRRPEDATRPPRLPLILSHSPPRLPHPLPRWPSASLAADRRSRRQRPPLAPPTSPSAPPRLPRPPHRATLRRKPCNAAYALVFNLGHPSRLRPSRPLHPRARYHLPTAIGEPLLRFPPLLHIPSP